MKILMKLAELIGKLNPWANLRKERARHDQELRSAEARCQFWKYVANTSRETYRGQMAAWRQKALDAMNARDRLQNEYWKTAHELKARSYDLGLAHLKLRETEELCGNPEYIVTLVEKFLAEETTTKEWGWADSVEFGRACNAFMSAFKAQIEAFQFLRWAKDRKEHKWGAFVSVANSVLFAHAIAARQGLNLCGAVATVWAKTHKDERISDVLSPEGVKAWRKATIELRKAKIAMHDAERKVAEAGQLKAERMMAAIA